MKSLLFLAFVTIVNCHRHQHLEPFVTLFSWKQLDFNFTDDSMRRAYLESGAFNPEKNAPLGLNVWGDKLFLTVPRWSKGVPATLNYVNITDAMSRNDTSPLLNPYPNWESNDITRPGSLVSILRPRIDECGRLWGVDDGVEDSRGEHRIIHQQRLIAIDLNTNEIILRYDFKDSDVEPISSLGDLTIDVDVNNCNDAYVYISDNTAPALLVYSMAKNDSWRITHNYFLPDPLNGFFHISGVRFSLSDGILGLSLSLPKADGSKTLYFRSISGIDEFGVSTSLIKNQTALADRLFFLQFEAIGHRGYNTQATSSVFDEKTEIMYMTQLNRNAIACWDTKRRLNPHTFHIVAQDDQKLSYTNDIIVDPIKKNAFVVSDKLPLLLFSKYNLNETNFYVHVASLENLERACRRQDRPHRRINMYWRDGRSMRNMSWRV